MNLLGMALPNGNLTPLALAETNADWRLLPEKEKLHFCTKG
jgi:hypothetical protein